MHSADKNKFWKSIKSFRSKNDKAKSEKRIPISEFAEYYSTLFSHIDRLSNQHQQATSKQVDEMYKAMKTSVFDDVVFLRL